MIKKHKKTLFIFRRDLRLEDNSGLIYALENSHEVIGCFIFNPLQLKDNTYRSDHCVQFMLESLQDLDEQLKKKGSHLYLFYEKQEEIVKKCIKNLGIDCVVINRDYTPFSKERDANLEKLSSQINIVVYEDALLQAPENTLKYNGEPYSRFSPYYKNASSIQVKNLKPTHTLTIFTALLTLQSPCLFTRKFYPKASLI